MAHLGTRDGLRGLTLGLALAALGCSGQGQPDQALEPAISSDGILVCGDVPNPVPGEGILHEWYSAFAMNNKLRHFPDFAATTGLDSVSSCSDARQFFAAYRDYNELHPRFDDGEPLEMPEMPAVEDDLPPPETRDIRAYEVPVPEVYKVTNGQGDMLAPVVQLFNGLFNGGNCTGSFISRNYLTTAAHCMAVEAGWNYGQPVANAKINKYRPYTITWPGAGGLPAGGAGLVFQSVRQLVDPRYIGFAGTGTDGNFDFAILWILNDDDNRLPNGVPDFLDNTAPFLRLSLKHASDGTTAQAWGWGQVDAFPANPRLQRGDLSGYALTSEVINTTKGPSERIKGEVPPAGSAYLCHGDSGGPLTNRYSIPDPAGGEAERFVQVALLSTGIPPTGCDTVAGDKIVWDRIDGEEDFIATSVRRWSYFPCNAKKSTSAGFLEDYMECWRKPCKETADCADVGGSCFHPGSQLKSCGTTCSSVDPKLPVGDCSCIYGECLDRKTPSQTF